MSVVLGDASIRVTLDPAAAKREAHALREEMRKLDEQRKKLTEEMERTANGQPGATATNRANASSPPLQPGQHRSATPSVNVESDDGGSKGDGLGGLLGKGLKFFALVKLVKGALQVGATVAKQLPLLTENLKSAAKGTMFEDLANKADMTAQQLAERVIKIEARLEAIADTKTDVIDYNMAALKLGRLPTDQVGIIQDFFEINSQQLALKKTMDTELQREMFRKLPEAFKNALNR